MCSLFGYIVLTLMMKFQRMRIPGQIDAMTMILLLAFAEFFG